MLPRSHLSTLIAPHKGEKVPCRYRGLGEKGRKSLSRWREMTRSRRRCGAIATAGEGEGEGEGEGMGQIDGPHPLISVTGPGNRQIGGPQPLICLPSHGMARFGPFKRRWTAYSSPITRFDTFKPPADAYFVAPPIASVAGIRAITIGGRRGQREMTRSRRRGRRGRWREMTRSRRRARAKERNRRPSAAYFGEMAG